jgi:hypothetical protein
VTFFSLPCTSLALISSNVSCQLSLNLSVEEKCVANNKAAAATVFGL